jgi:hypothetical protein
MKLPKPNRPKQQPLLCSTTGDQQREREGEREGVVTLTLCTWSVATLAGGVGDGQAAGLAGGWARLRVGPPHPMRSYGSDSEAAALPQPARVWSACCFDCVHQSVSRSVRLTESLAQAERGHVSCRLKFSTPES